ncbi:hypothetical protein ACLX1H_002950 [Fusarium chlamydosporum]
MSVDNPFSVFPREIRDLIYTYSIIDVQFIDALKYKTAYPKIAAPLLYLNKTIAQDAQHLLYKHKNLEMGIMVFNPTEYETSEGFAPLIKQCSRRMKQSSSRLIIGTSRFMAVPGGLGVQYINIHDGTTAEDWINKFCGLEGHEPLAKKLIDELISLRPELPNVRVIEFKFFNAFRLVVRMHWLKYFMELRDAWPEIDIDLGYLNGFDGSEHLQQWKRVVFPENS